MTPTGQKHPELEAGVAFVMLCILYVCIWWSELNEWPCAHTAICVCLCMFEASLTRAYACVT